MREPANRRLIIVVAAEPRPPVLFTGPLGQGNNMKALTIHRARSPGVYGHLILVLTRSLHRSPGQAKRSPGLLSFGPPGRLRKNLIRTRLCLVLP